MKKHLPFLILLGVFVIFHLISLTRYPKVHDDEGFLANWALLLYEKGLPLIDPHLSYHGYFKDVAVVPFDGILFYGSLALLGHLFGFNLYALRLQPLLFSLVTMILTYNVAILLFNDWKKSFLAVSFLACSPKFLVTSHMISQEPMLIACLMAMFFFFLKGLKHRLPSSLCAAFLSGFAICIHPNGVFFPFILGGLTLFVRKSWLGLSWGLVLKMVLFSFFGGLIFLFVDYLPHREYYWAFFHSPLWDGITNRYKILPFSFVRVFKELLQGLWGDFWNPGYHRNMLYFLLNTFAVAGALSIRLSSHRLILTTLLFVFLILLPVHVSEFYFAYLTPFFCLLMGSVLIELWERVRHEASFVLKRGFSISFAFVVAVVAIQPLVTLWFFRNYDFYRISQRLREKIGQEESVIGSHAYFFGLPSEQLYSYIPIRLYSVKRLMSELKIDYFILDRATFELVDPQNPKETHAQENETFLFKECSVSLTLADYQAHFQNPNYRGNSIILFDCRKALSESDGYHQEEMPVLSKTLISFGDPIRVKVYELNAEPAHET